MTYKPCSPSSALWRPRKGSVPAEACHMGMHMHSPKQPLQSQDCISGRNVTNSWAAGPSRLSTRTRPASAPAPASRTEAALGSADRDYLPWGPWGSRQCLCGQGHFLRAPSTKKGLPFQFLGKENSRYKRELPSSRLGSFRILTVPR